MMTPPEEKAPEPAPLLGGWMEADEVARALGIAPDTLKRWRMLGTAPPGVRLGRRIVYRRDAVRKWLREREGRAAPTSASPPMPRR